jgi:hypothetical protein
MGENTTATGENTGENSAIGNILGKAIDILLSNQKLMEPLILLTAF